MTFYQAKKGLKKMAAGKYHNIRYGITEYKSGELSQECSVYIDGYNWHKGLTWDEVLKKMKAEINPKPIYIEDIEELK